MTIWARSWKVAVMMAWEATMAARIAKTMVGMTQPVVCQQIVHETGTGKHTMWNRGEYWVGVRLRVDGHVRRLPNIGKQQARQTITQPADLNSMHAESSQIGEKGLHSCERQEHTA